MTIEIIKFQNLSSGFVFLFKSPPRGERTRTDFSIYHFRDGDAKAFQTASLGDKEPLAMECVEIKGPNGEQGADQVPIVHAIIVVREGEKFVLQVVRLLEKKVKSLMYLTDPGNMG